MKSCNSSFFRINIISMNVGGIIENDIVDCDDGVCVSFWAQGCGQKKKCEGCHNPQLWDFNGGQKIPVEQVIEVVDKLINKNGIKRHLSVLGGEPLCEQNKKDVADLISAIHKKNPTIKIYLWSGYTFEQLDGDPIFDEIRKNITYLIDGPYDYHKRDINLKLRGSSNQRIIEFDKDGNVVNGL